jgi:uncharacterized membrane protein (UPF0127 family)
MKRLFCFGVLLFLFGTACQRNSTAPAPPTNVSAAAEIAAPIPTQAQPKLKTMKIYLGANEMDAEIAANDLQRQTGMMFRTEMKENEGMLFVFPWPHQTAFWMKNTRLPLSAAYIDPEGKIREIHELKPFDTNSAFATARDIQYVLETPAGWFQRNNVSTGAVIRTEHGTLRDTFFKRR